MSIATPESRRALPSCGGRMNAYILTRKAATLYGNARVIMPKIPRSRNGFIASIRDASSPVKQHL